MDLRGHGESPKGTAGPSLEAAARDVVALATRAGMPLVAIAGHSFGGKVALEVARVGGIASLQDVVIIDSTPAAREPQAEGDSPLAILRIIEALPAGFDSISSFIAALMGAGLSRELAQWLASSLEREGQQLRFSLNTGEIRALILDYYAQDLWSVIEKPPGETRVHLVIGERSTSFSEADRNRAAQIAAANGRVTVDVLPAGHWVHVDDPEGLLDVLIRLVT